MLQAKFVTEIVVTDPDSGGLVEVEIYKHPNGGMFGIDSSYLDQNFDDDECPIVPDPFEVNGNMVGIKLVETNNLK